MITITLIVYMSKLITLLNISIDEANKYKCSIWNFLWNIYI